MTAQEKRELEEKLAELHLKDTTLVVRIAEARAKGDLKENAEYHAAREDKAMNLANIKHLTERLGSAIVFDDSEVPEDMVFVGGTVRLRDEETGDDEVYKLVGEARAEFDSDYIEVSVDSPMGAALMKSRVGETIRVDQPRGAKRFTIVELM